MSPCARGGAGGAEGEPLPTAGAVPEHPSISRGPRNTPTHACVCERGKEKPWILFRGRVVGNV